MKMQRILMTSVFAIICTITESENALATEAYNSSTSQYTAAPVINGMQAQAVMSQPLTQSVPVVSAPVSTLSTSDVEPRVTTGGRTNYSNGSTLPQKYPLYEDKPNHSWDYKPSTPPQSYERQEPYNDQVSITVNELDEQPRVTTGGNKNLKKYPLYEDKPSYSWGYKPPISPQSYERQEPYNDQVSITVNELDSPRQQRKNEQQEIKRKFMMDKSDQNFPKQINIEQRNDQKQDSNDM